MTYYFIPPTVEEGPAGGGPLFFRYRLNRADTVIKTLSGSYYQVRTPGIEELEQAALFYQGGHKYPISDQERLSLIAAGYGPNITEE